MTPPKVAKVVPKGLQKKFQSDRIGGFGDIGNFIVTKNSNSEFLKKKKPYGPLTSQNW